MSWTGWLIIALPVVLGLLAGRFPRLRVLVVVPFITAWVLYELSYGGPGDDISGPAATAYAVLGTGVFLLAALLSWVVLRAWRNTRPGGPSRS